MTVAGCEPGVWTGVTGDTGVGSAIIIAVVTGTIVAAVVGAGVTGGRGTLVFGDMKAG